MEKKKKIISEVFKSRRKEWEESSGKKMYYCKRARFSKGVQKGG